MRDNTASSANTSRLWETTPQALHRLEPRRTPHMFTVVHDYDDATLLCPSRKKKKLGYVKRKKSANSYWLAGIHPGQNMLFVVLGWGLRRSSVIETLQTWRSGPCRHLVIKWATLQSMHTSAVLKSLFPVVRCLIWNWWKRSCVLQKRWNCLRQSKMISPEILETVSQAPEVRLSNCNDWQLGPPCTGPRNGGTHAKIGDCSVDTQSVAHSVSLVQLTPLWYRNITKKLNAVQIF